MPAVFDELFRVSQLGASGFEAQVDLIASWILLLSWIFYSAIIFFSLVFYYARKIKTSAGKAEE